MSIKCAICEISFDNTDDAGWWVDKGHTGYPVCKACHFSGKHAEWRNKAIEELNASPFLIESKGNLALDIKQLRAYKKHSARIEDGVCPNGCALLTTIDDSASECHVCHFQLRKTNL